MAGKNNQVADALSHSAINAVLVLAPGIDYSALAAAQRDYDEMLAYRTAISSLILEDIPLGSTDITVLCDVSTGQPRHIVPTAWRRRIFDSIHRLAHPSIRATTALMAAKFVWQGLCKQVCSWARACVLCQTYKVQHHVRAPLQDFAIPQHRFDHIHVDLVGPLPPSCSVTHLLTIVDLLRRWPEDVPLADTSATTCERALTAH